MRMVSYRPFVRTSLMDRPVARLMNEFMRDPKEQTVTSKPVQKHFHVPVNIVENEEDFRLEMAIPGMKKDAFNVKVEDDILYVSTKEQDNAESTNGVKYLRREFSTPVLNKRFQLPETVDQNAIEATYEDGVLRILLGKLEEAKPQPPKTVEIK